MKKYKNGFTILELLVTIALVLLVATIIIPSVTMISNNVRESQYESQIKLIEAAGREWGEDNLNSLSSGCTYKTVGDLINSGYLKGDKNNKTEMHDPRSDDSMNCYKVCITYSLQSEKDDKSHNKVRTQIVEKCE